MILAQNSTAWSHGPTRRAWTLHVCVAVSAGFLWVGCWVLLLAISVYASDWVVWVCLPCFLYGPYRVAAQVKIVLTALSMRRVLRAYSWSVACDAPRGLTDRPEVAGGQFGWFEFPNPARTDQLLPLVFRSHLGTRWWARRMGPGVESTLKGQIDSVWFAGDPRFIGVIAAPTRDGVAPRRLHLVEQRIDEDSGQRFSDWCATADDIERGRRAGVHPVGLAPVRRGFR